MHPIDCVKRQYRHIECEGIFYFAAFVRLAGPASSLADAHRFLAVTPEQGGKRL
jgi:hypothetical protein